MATAVEPAARPAVRANGVAPAEAVPVGRKAMIAIGEFMVKAAGAGQFVGDGLREMMMTTMHENGRFIVVERLDLQGLAAEQALSRSPLARPDAVIAERQMDVAEIMVSAAVTEFELEASGSGLELGVPKIPMLATGGVVTAPTLAVIGEAGPEAVVPLSQAGSYGLGGGETIQVTVHAGAVGSESYLARVVTEAIETARRRGTLGRA